MVGAMFEVNVKYELLTSLLQRYIKNVQYSNNVNVIIDLKSFYKKAYRTDVNNIISDQKIAIEDITSTVINSIAHYRNYLYKEGKYSTFFILYSEKECEIMQNRYPDYKKKYYEKYLNNKEEFLNLNNIMKSVTKQIKILCQYIPHVSFIETSKYDEFIYCNYLIREVVNKNDVNIILSSDPVFLQALNKNTVCLNLKGQNSKLINTNNAIEYLTENEDINLSANLLNLILSVSGVDEYSIENIQRYGYKKTVKRIKALVDNGLLMDKTYIKIPTDILSKDEFFKANIDKIRENFLTVFPLDIQFDNMLELSTSYYQNKLKATLNEFCELNSRIFLYFPLNLEFLLRGETI